MKQRKTNLLMVLTLVSLTSTAQQNIPDHTQYSNQDRHKVTPINGLTQIVIETTHEQQYPLDTVVTMEFPSDVINVGQALNFVLQNSGYHLRNLSKTTPETLNLYTMEIPLSHRQFYQATIGQVVNALAGQGYEVIIDNVAREIGIYPFK